MIDVARALITQTDARIDELSAEVERLTALRTALAAFIEQPPTGAGIEVGHASIDEEAAARTVASPIQQPSAGRGRASGRRGLIVGMSLACDGCERTFDTAQRLGSHRWQAHRARPEPAPNAHSGERVECPDCGESLRPMGFGPHRRRSKRHAAAVASAAAVVAARPPRSEKYLCSRCPAEFLSKVGRDEHQGLHPPVPPATPLRQANGGPHLEPSQ